MRFNKYQPFAWIYFFINSVALPFGLTWTAVLGPFFYGWVLWKRKQEVLMPLAAVLIPFVTAHLLFAGADGSSYCISLLNLVLIYCFGQAFYTFLKQAADKEKILYQLLVINFACCLAAIGFYFTPLQTVFWIRQNLTDGVSGFLRLKMFTYEASYYAMLFVPLFLFFGWQYFLRLHQKKGALLLLMISLPLLLSFSIGVMASLLIALLLTLLLHHRALLRRKRILNGLLNTGFFLLLAFTVLFIFFRDNALFARIGNILAGEDTSGKGRTMDAFVLALKIIKEKSEWWGIGPGQLKSEGQQIIRSYYLYYTNTPVAIPNAAAETLLLFGWIGFTLRIFALIFFFLVTKVWSNYLRLSLFLFMFVYQFTGSYITNPAEYVIWILAFTNAFPQFDARRWACKSDQRLPALNTASRISVS